MEWRGGEKWRAAAGITAIAAADRREGGGGLDVSGNIVAANTHKPLLSSLPTSVVEILEMLRGHVQMTSVLRGGGGVSQFLTQ